MRYNVVYSALKAVPCGDEDRDSTIMDAVSLCNAFKAGWSMHMDK